MPCLPYITLVLKTTLIHIQRINDPVRAYNEAKEKLEKVRIKDMQDRQKRIDFINEHKKKQRSMKSWRLITSLQRKQYPRCVYRLKNFFLEVFFIINKDGF